MIALKREKGRITINLKCIRMGNDLCVIITGGDRPHLGAVALSVPRPSLADSKKRSASTSVLTLIGHKEDETAKRAAHLLAARLNTNVVVSCGIHLDNIEKEEMETIYAMLDELVQEMADLHEKGE